MPRTTSSEVQGVLLADYNSNTSPDLTPFITIANLMVTRVATCAATKGKTLSTDELLMLETLLAAHAYQQSDQGYTSRSTGGASGSFQGQTGMYLEGSKYGQLALNLDYSGCLAAISKRQTAGGSWLGTTDTAAQTYDERN